MIEPTDRSNSPEIINNATPIVIVPDNVTALRIPEMERRVRNLGTKRDNSRKIMIRTAKGPARVDSENRWRSLVCQVSGARMGCSTPL
jgi:hypothetical protein